MSEIKILVVEDDESEVELCKKTFERYHLETERKVALKVCISVEEAFSCLHQGFDGAIIDLTLNYDGDAGNKVIRRIEEEFIRIPIAVLTGTPDAVSEVSQYLGVFKKGDPGSGYYDLLGRFWSIHNTGLTRILGGRGLIESKLTEVFQKNLLPQIEQWEKYGGDDSEKTEKALLRHALHHLVQLIDKDMDQYYPEEFYLYPPPSDDIRTGSILEAKCGNQKYVAVLSPDCDLVIREDGTRNTDRILFAEVISPEVLFEWFDTKSQSDFSKTKKTKIQMMRENKGPRYFHCLPMTDFFPLGFINFRKVSTLAECEIKGKFKTPPKIQISPPFVKDIVARFSTFYARQGQPSIDFGYPYRA